MKLFIYRGGVCRLCCGLSDGVVVKDRFREDERLYICEKCVGRMGDFMPVTIVDAKPGAWDCICKKSEDDKDDKCVYCGGENVHTGDSI